MIMYYKRLVIFYWLSLLIFISCTDEKRSSMNIVNYDLKDIEDERFLLSDIADSIIYYPISFTGYKTMNSHRRLDIHLTNDCILIWHIRIGQLFNRYTGELIREIDLGSPFEQPSFFWGNSVSKNYITPSGEGYYILERIEQNGKPYFRLLTKSLSNDSLLNSIQLPSFSSFPLNKDLIWEWKHTNISDSAITMNWYNNKDGLLKKTTLNDIALSKNNLIHILKDSIFYHSDGSSKIYLLKNDSILQLFNIRNGKIRNLHIGFDKLFFSNVFLEEEIPFFINHNKIYRLSSIDSGLINDIDGGLNFWPKNVSGQGEIYTWYNVEDLKAKISQNDSEQMKNPKAARRLKNMLDNLSEDVNYMIAVLKEKNCD